MNSVCVCVMDIWVGSLLWNYLLHHLVVFLTYQLVHVSEVGATQALSTDGTLKKCDEYGPVYPVPTFIHSSWKCFPLDMRQSPSIALLHISHTLFSTYENLGIVFFQQKKLSVNINEIKAASLYSICIPIYNFLVQRIL